VIALGTVAVGIGLRERPHGNMMPHHGSRRLAVGSRPEGLELAGALHPVIKPAGITERR
jgi:hypothetical protein